jgi:hypothetical protein
MKTMNKKERRQADLARHYAFLERLSEFLGHKQDGKKLSLKLLKLEREAHQAATDYCNGENGMTAEKWEAFSENMKWKVFKLFQYQVPGLIVNGDARGYALKIDDAVVREMETKYADHNYPETLGFYRDWGGYGILSPEIQ